MVGVHGCCSVLLWPREFDRIDSKLNLVLSALRDAPLARLKAAKNQGVSALRHADRTSLIAAAQNAEQAARDLLSQAARLVRVEIDGLPVALRCPVELADLTEGAAEAVKIASAMHLALGFPDIASRILEEAADTISSMRTKLWTALTDPELLIRRTNPELADATAHIAAGKALHQIQHWVRGRAVMIDAGLISADQTAAEFESVREVDGLFFETAARMAQS